MAEIILPTLPVNGGAMAIAAGQADICRLTENRYFAIFGQYGSGANLTFGAVYTIANPFTATPTAVINRQQVIQDFASRSHNGYMTCWRLDDTHVLVGFSPSTGSSLNFNVIAIDPVTNIMTRQLASDVTMPGTTVLWSTADTNRMAAKGELQADNNFVFASMDQLYAIHVDRLVYNSGSNTLTRTRVLTGTTGSSNVSAVADISKIPSSNKLCITLRSYGAVNSFSGAQPTIVYILGPSDNAVTTLVNNSLCNAASSSTQAHSFVPLSETSGVFVYGSKLSRHWTSANGLSGALIANGAYGGSQYTVMEGFALSDSYYVITTTQNQSPAIKSGSGGCQLRVVKFTDQNVSQVSTGTTNGTNGNGLLIVSGNMMQINKNIERLSTTNLMTVSMVNNSISFKVITLWF